MSTVVVFGGGRMGKDVARQLQHHDLLVCDVTEKPDGWDSSGWEQVDLSDIERTKAILNAGYFDVAVNCMPADLGKQTNEAVIRRGLSVIDMSFAEEDMKELNDLAQQNHVHVFHDVGFAPGIPDLLIGRALRDSVMGLRDVRIYAGGIARFSAINPLGYVCTWNPKDLASEFFRPARYRLNGQEFFADPLNTPNELIQIGPYIFETFISDGVRSLLDCNDIDTIVERTVRWPGHMDKIREYTKDGYALFRILEDCVGEDMVVMRVDIDGRSQQMIVHAEEDRTAMQRATAGMCAAVTQVYLDTKMHDPLSSLSFVGGVTPLWKLGARPCQLVLKELARKGMHIDPAPMT